ncbi:multidrug and toxin extrusion protein 2-like [Eubalaena glacialis]|uniref:multidrug and toxin extrusion protein 2-like n=1 Tax=Eubalaena glacialis TaxID=27606 RepID=UPI002A59B940|nr:multidrug and toxin extrusion protein 2-like [Eubalaena glacialis]
MHRGTKTKAAPKVALAVGPQQSPRPGFSFPPHRAPRVLRHLPTGHGGSSYPLQISGGRERNPPGSKFFDPAWGGGETSPGNQRRLTRPPLPCSHLTLPRPQPSPPLPRVPRATEGGGGRGRAAALARLPPSSSRDAVETPAAPAPPAAESPSSARDGAQRPGTLGWRECLRPLRGALPPDVGRETAELEALAGPVFLAQLLTFLISLVSSVFCGHLGKVELDAVTLAVSVVTVAGISVGTGFASACDALMSQSFGAKNLERVGIVLQRSILIPMLCCFPRWALFLNTKRLLLLLKQDPEVSRRAQIYVMILIPSLPATFLFQLQAKYLQSQGIIMPQVVTGIAANDLNVGTNALLLYALHFGVIGSAWADTTSQFCLSALLFLYVWWKKFHVNTWGGWTRACFQEWGSFTQLAIPSTFTVCIECWTFEVGTCLAGLMSVTELGAQAVIYVLASAAYMVPLGLGVAASVWVGGALGAGDAQQARHSCATVLLCAGVCALVTGILLAALKDVVAYAFTSDKDVMSLVSQVMPISAPFHLFDALAGTSGGVLRGAGKQNMGAFLNAIGYYVFGFPLGASLMFAANHGIIGLWSGLMVCVFFQTLFYLVYIWRINWNRVAEQAQVRAGLRGTKEAVPTATGVQARKRNQWNNIWNGEYKIIRLFVDNMIVSLENP